MGRTTPLKERVCMPATAPVYPANTRAMSAADVEKVRQRKYPKWMYHPTQPPTLVDSAEIEETLGSEWVETPAALPTAPPTIVIPSTREEYHKLSQDQAMDAIEACDNRDLVEMMRSSEITHPRRPNGRPRVLTILEARLTALEPAKEAEPPKRPRGRPPKIASAPMEIAE